MSTVLAGSGRSGDFVHNNQVMAEAQDFRNVSKLWYDKTQSFDDTLATLEKHYDRRRDIRISMFGMKPTATDAGFRLVAQGGPTDGAAYSLTPHALHQYLDKLDISRSMVTLLEDKAYPNKGEDAAPKIKRDRKDTELFVDVVMNGLRHFSKRNEKGGNDYLFRTYDDTKEVQAVLTKEYSSIDNRWVLRIVNELIPGGRYSHMKRADDATLYGNVLIPDSIREENDGDYGAMLSLSNCEIGKRKLAGYPSVFRAICMNGCIWDQTKGVAFEKRHRGLNDLDIVKRALVDNLTKQIPLAHSGVDKLLATRGDEYKVKGVKMSRVFVAIGDMFGLQPKHVAQSFIEYMNFEKDNRNLFGVVAGITRAGQKFANEDWAAMDACGGELMKFKSEKWQGRIVNVAKELDEEYVDKVVRADVKSLQLSA